MSFLLECKLRSIEPQMGKLRAKKQGVVGVGERGRGVSLSPEGIKKVRVLRRFFSLEKRNGQRSR